MSYVDYLRRYNWRLKRLRSLGLTHPRKIWWRLSKYNKVEYRQTQLNDMLATIYQMMINEKEAQAG